VRPKTSVQPSPELLPTILKYLESIENIESYSFHTVRSYRVDLGQAFGVVAVPDSENSRLPLPKRLPLGDAELLGRCRQALTFWSNLAPASRNRKAATLKSFLHWLHEKELIEKDLALQIHAPKVPQRLPHHLSVDEATALLTSLKTQIESAETEGAKEQVVSDRILILLLYGGGLRVSEACNLRWSEVDFSARVLRIKGKGGKERLVALPEMAVASLKSHSRTGDFVFGAQALSTRTAYERVKIQGARAGLLKPLHPHALRHSFATHLLSSGANLRTLQELLGHRTLQATQRYTHIGVDQLARTMEKFHPFGDQSGAAPAAVPAAKARSK
jgi:site-specific recombinase XerD